MLNSSGLLGGFQLQNFIDTTGLSSDILLNKVKLAESKGLLTISGENIKPTTLGFNFLNELQQIFLS